MIKKQARNTRVAMSVMMEGSRGTGRRDPDPASKAGGGDSLSQEEATAEKGQGQRSGNPDL